MTIKWGLGCHPQLQTTFVVLPYKKNIGEANAKNSPRVAVEDDITAP